MYDVALTFAFTGIAGIVKCVNKDRIYHITFGYLVYILESTWDCVAWNYK